MYKRVAVCIDGSDESRQAFRASIQDRQTMEEFYILYFPKIAGPVKDDDLAQGLALCRQYGKELPFDFQVQLHTACVISDKPKETAVVWLKENSIDAVYVGSRGRGAISRFFLGSFSAYLCNHAKCDVLVISRNKSNVSPDKSVKPETKEKDVPMATQLKIRPLVICGPSGVGKGSLLDGKLLKEFPEDFGKSVSHTTRAARRGEEDGHHYHFTTVDQFLEELSQGAFLEHTKVHDNYYGTSVAAVEQVAMTGRICLLEIDIQGAEAIQHKSDLTPNFVFIVPPSLEALEARLRARGSESEESLQKRLATARREMEYYDKCGLKHTRIVNDNLEEAYRSLKAHLITCYPQLANGSSD